MRWASLDAVQDRGTTVSSTSSSAAGARAAYAVIGEDALYPCCLLHRDLRASLEAWLRQPDRAVRHWLHAEDAVAAPLRGWQADVFNLNTAEALDRAAQWLAAGKPGAAL